jgi:hypothetical protein
VADCIPFITMRATTKSSGSGDLFEEYAVSADFDTGTTVRVRRSGATAAVLVVEVTVVEFDPAEVTVYQGTGAMADDENSVVLDDPYGGSVDIVLADTFLYFTYTTEVTNDWWEAHNVRGVVTDVDTLTFDKDETGSVIDIDWYVAEATGGAWAVDHVAITLADTDSTEPATIGSVDTAKTFILGSYKGADDTADADANDANTVDVELTNSTTVTATRVGDDQPIDWAGCVVELAGAENVYRGSLSHAASSPQTSATFTAVTIADSMVHVAGHSGNLGGGSFPGTGSAQVGDTFTAWTFLSTTTVESAHHIGGSETGTVSWEVIEWEVGGAPPPTRRVMVIS